MFDFMPKGKPEGYTGDLTQSTDTWQNLENAPSLPQPLVDPMQAYKNQLSSDYALPSPTQEQPSNPVVGQNLFLVNPFPIRQNDNLILKGIKGIGDFAASTLDAPTEMLRKIALQGGSILSGNGIRNDLPKNTTFTGDILPTGAADTLNTFQMQHPVLGGLANAAIETAADPTMYLGEKAVSNFLKPKNSLDLAKIDVPKNPFSGTLDNAQGSSASTPLQSIELPKPTAQNVIQQAELPNTALANIEIPKVETPTLQKPKTNIPNIDNPSLPQPLRERQFAQNTVLNSRIAPDVLKNSLKENLPTYEPITNKATFDKATNIVNQDVNKAVSDFYSPAKHGVNADDVALGEALIAKAIKSGNADEANRLITDLAEKLTTAGQAVQAASIFKRLTPEGMLMYAQRMVNNANKDLFDRLGKKAQDIVLTSDDSQFILDTMKNVQQLPDGRERDIELAKVMARIANKVPATMEEKIKGLQRITMLLNPKTMVRNTVGNMIFGTIDNASNVLATPIDKLTGKLTGQRTTTLPSISGQLRSMQKGVGETVQDARLGIDTYPGQTQYELPSKRIFDTGLLNKLDQTTKVGLQIGDRPFYQAAYDDVLRQQMKLANVDAPTQSMIDQATNIAKQRTYQDTNKITQAADGLRAALNKALGGKDFGFGNVVLPFTKTPANILKRAIEYSPIGLGTTVQEAVNLAKQNGKFDQKAFVDSISRSATGTGMIMAGYELAQKGILTGTGNKDKDVASFERNLGKSDFAVKLGNIYYTYDWAQPASLALAVGADMFLKGSDKKQAQNAVIEGIKSGGETLLKQSFLQGIQKLFGGYAPMDSLESTAYNAPAQFIPSLSNQITQLIDPVKRSINANSIQDKAINTIKTKIPGLSTTLEPSIDTSGKPILQYQGNNNPFNVFVNPGKSTQFNPNNIQTEILKVYESTGRKDIFPQVAPKSITDNGKTITLTPSESTRFQQTMGENTSSKMEPIVNSSYPDTQKAELMATAVKMAYGNARQELLNSRK